MSKTVSDVRRRKYSQRNNHGRVATASIFHNPTNINRSENKWHLLSKPKFYVYVSYQDMSEYKLPVPNDLASLYKDIVYGTGQSIVSLFSDIQRQLNEEHNKAEVIRRLGDLKLLFELLKRSYDETTMNYEIYHETESQLYDLIGKIKESNFEAANNISKELMMVFKTLTEINFMIHDTGSKVLIVEDTGQKLGEMRIFKTKRD